ncbi:thiamine pyrophosphate-binding protein [Verminephrobacter eiseniae]|nr:thiamine pyrophosphate-binding protein [Verminephrobacter eiseniae]
MTISVGTGIGLALARLVSRHRSSVGPRWPSKRIAALHRLPIRSVLAARCALRCAPMAARSLRHLIGDATLGIRRAFGVVGSGNFHFTNGLIDGGVQFVAARHEGGAATMADAYARMSGEVAVVSVHQGCLTNAITGIGEAAKSRTPLLVVSGETADSASNFYMDQDGLARSVGAVSLRLRSAATALADTRAAYALALRDRRTVLLNLPLHIQSETLERGQLASVDPVAALARPQAAPQSIEALAELLKTAERPVFIAGRGGRGTAARAALLALADDVGALLAEGAVAKGLFAGQPWAIDVAGGFSSPLTAELIAGADVVVGRGSALNMWTTGHGRLLGKDVRLVQVGLDVEAIGRNRTVAPGIVGDVAATAQATSERLRTQGHRRRGYRTPQLQRIDAAILWRDTPYDDTGTTAKIDPRTLSIVLDDLIPTDRVVGVDSGNFMGYPSMYLRVPDENSFAFTQAFQSIGLGLATSIGTALAQPGRFPVVIGGPCREGLSHASHSLLCAEAMVRLRVVSNLEDFPCSINCICLP